MIQPLSPDRCPLLAKLPELLGRFNAVAADLSRVEIDDPVFFARKDIQSLLTEAGQVRELLGRSHYEVGSIGLHQVSKSTTFNRLLRASEADKPAMEGETSDATTAAVTRVRPAPPDAAENRLTLRYLTRDGYARKRDGLVATLAADGTGVNPEASEDELRQTLPALIQEAKQRKLTHHEENLGYLQRLIDSARAHGAQVLRDGEQGLEAPKPYAQRRAYINHPGDPTTPLLRDVVLEYRTDVVPPEVETIDMPGLGAGLLIDTILSKELMARLNGVLLFCDVLRDVSSELIGRVLGRLRQQFPDGLRGRAWVVFTKCDTLAPSHFREPDSNIFTGITAALKKYGLGPDQVCFVCNFWDGKPPGDYERFLADRVGTADLAGKFPRHPELVKAFGELGRNGGIDRLRELITHTLGAEVARETRREIGRRLDDLAESLRVAKELREQERRFDPQRRKQLTAVLHQIKSTQAHVESRRDLLPEGEPLADYFQGPAKALGDELTATLDDIYPEQRWLRGESLDRVAKDYYPDHARELEERLHQLLTTRMLPEVYRRVGQAFDGLAAVPVASCRDGVGPRWEQWLRDDCRDRSWRERWRMPSFEDKLLFTPQRVRPLQALDGLGYRRLMLEKIRATSHQAGHAVRMRVREHLQALEQTYREALKVQDELRQDPASGGR